MEDVAGGRFGTDPFCAGLGVCVEAIDPAQVRIRIPFKEEIANPGNALHGGVMASAIDIAGSCAALAAVDHKPGLDSSVLDLNVSYLAAAIGEDIVATAEVLRRGKEITYSAVDVRTDTGKRIAAGLVTHRAFDLESVAAARERQLSTMTPLPLPQTMKMIRGANMFVSFGFISRLGIGVEHAHDGEAVLPLPFKVENADASGAVHEGALAALIDTTGALASWSIVGLNMSYKASTVGMHVSYHAAACGEDLVAHAKTLRRNNEIFLNQVTVSSRASGKIIATGSVTYRIVVND